MTYTNINTLNLNQTIEVYHSTLTSLISTIQTNQEADSKILENHCLFTSFYTLNINKNYF